MPTTHLSNLVSSKPKKLEEIAFSETVEVSTRHYADWKYGKETRLIPWEHLLAVGTKAIRGNQHLVVSGIYALPPTESPNALSLKQLAEFLQETARVGC